MKIPVGNFGNAIAAPAPAVNSSQGTGLAQLGNVGMQIGAQMLEEQRALNRIKAGNELSAYQLAAKQVAIDMIPLMDDGTIKSSDAAAYHKEKIAALPKPDLEYADENTQEAARGGIEIAKQSSALALQPIIRTTMKKEQKTEVVTALDLILKDAGTPGADVAKSLERLNTWETNGVIAFGADGWAAIKQTTRDKAYFNDVVQKTLQNRDNMGGLKALEQELKSKDGYYIDKLDTDKREQAWSAVASRIDQLETRNRHFADKSEARAQQVINQIDRQIASGVPMTAQMWDEADKITRGTALHEDYRQRIKDEKQVQEVLRMPLDKQVEFVQGKEALLLNEGGNLREKANIDRLKTSINTNVKTLQNMPLIFAQNRTGQAVEPLDFNAMADGKATALIQERIATIAALQKEYGPQVKMLPLLPQEAAQLASSLEKYAPKQQAATFGILRGMIGNDAAYRSTMQQLAPDNPVMAEAGVLASHSLPVAELVLRGQQILNPDKKTDGKGKELKLPSEKDMNEYFANMENNAYSGKEKARHVAYQTAVSIYAAKSVDSGDYSGQLDFKRWKESIKAATGGFEKYKGRSIVMPYGMQWGDFKDALKIKTADLVSRGTLDQSFTDSKLRGLPLENVGDARYIFRAGDGVVTDKTGKPVILDFTK
jgi:hypothetical protein